MTKRGKIIALIGALALVCVTCAVTMFATGVLPEETRGGYIFDCTDENCSCHEEGSIVDNICNACPKCRGERIYTPDM